MEKYRNQKDLQMAINGRMLVMAMGLMLLINSFTSTVGYSIGFFQIASRAGKNDAEILAMMAEMHKSAGFFWMAGVVSSMATLLEIFVGVFCVRFSNRLRASKMAMKLGIALMVGEVFFNAFLMMLGLKHPIMLLAALVVPGALLWGASRLNKLMKEYPNREYAVDTEKTRAAQAAKAPKKSMMERAKAQVKDEAQVTRVLEELPTEEEKHQDEPKNENKTETEETSEEN